MKIPKYHSVFVSSTFEDLKAEREAVMKQLLISNCIPLGMEEFSASDLSPWEYIKKTIDLSDYYILIIAGKYGSIDKESQISYTEKEFDYAVEKGIPIMAFLFKDVGKLAQELCEDTTKRKRMLLNFREKVMNSQKTVSFYTNIDNLCTSVSVSMNNIVRDRPAIGWVRASEVTESDNNIMAAFEDLKKLVVERTNFEIPTFEPISKEEIDKMFEETE